MLRQPGVCGGGGGCREESQLLLCGPQQSRRVDRDVSLSSVSKNVADQPNSIGPARVLERQLLSAMGHI